MTNTATVQMTATDFVALVRETGHREDVMVLHPSEVTNPDYLTEEEIQAEFAEYNEFLSEMERQRCEWCACCD